MATIVGLCGSLRAASYNGMLLRAARDVAPPGTTLDIATIRGIPLYDGDVEAADGVPEPVQALKARIAAADGLLIATPEYNNAMPGVLKNALDWLTRPPADIGRVFGGLPVAVVGATPGRGATALAQASWLPVLRTLRTVPWFGGRITIAGAGSVFDAEGRLVDDGVRTQIATFMQGFAEFVEAHRPASRRGGT